MSHFLPAAALVFCALGAAPALAEARCSIPRAEWQPRAAVQQLVEAQGWRVTGISASDGCYKVRATNDRGERYEGTFHPGTLRLLKLEIEYP